MADPTSFSECQDAADDRRIRQGDVFEWLEDGGNDPWTRLGIVVTADCDITHKKHRGILSYVPVLALRDYLALFYLPGRVERVTASIRQQIIKVVRTLQAERAPEFPEPISEPAALRWVREATAGGVANELGVPDGRERDQFVALGADFMAAEDALSRGTFDDLFNIVVRLRMRQESSREKVLSTLWKDIEALVTSLPGDAFFFGRIGPDHGRGYVAYLRLVREIEQTRIAVRQSDLRTSGFLAKRIGAMKSPYVYRLTQQLAEVFAAIGLPHEYEHARLDLLQRAAQDNV